MARSVVLLDDGTAGDTRANDDIHTNDALVYSAVTTREDDAGPRTMRFQAEVIGPDGLRHAIAVDAATLTVSLLPKKTPGLCRSRSMGNKHRPGSCAPAGSIRQLWNPDSRSRPP